MSKNHLRYILDWEDGTEEYAGNLIKKVSGYENIIIFGAGIGGKGTVKLLKENGYENRIKAFSDNNEDKIGTCYEGYPVIKPTDIIAFYPDEYIILVSSTAFRVISQQLISLGINEGNIYFFQPAGISLESKKDIEFVKEKIVYFEMVYEMLADEKSKEIYKDILNYRITKNQSWLDRMEKYIDKEDMQYFDQEILKDYFWTQEGIVDAGAYIGDTLDNFYRIFPDAAGNYYCFEAVKHIYDQLCINVENGKRKNVFAFNYAVWSQKGEIRFDVSTYGNGEGCRESSSGEETVKCDTLDTLLGNRAISFIKMDIEGAERNALWGGVKIIRDNKPVLAICIYHKPEDFYDIPLLIEQLLPNEYIYYIRQYRYGQSETVLYAMPNSRRK